MEAVDADVEGVVVFVKEAYDFLCVAVGGDFLQSAEAPHAVVDMGDIVAWLELEELLEGEGLVGVAHVADGVFMITLKYLVVGKADNMLIIVNKAMIDLALKEFDIGDRSDITHPRAIGYSYRIDITARIGKDTLQSALLLVIGNGDKNLIPTVAIVMEGIGQQIKLLVEYRLGSGMGFHQSGIVKVATIALLYYAATQH